MSTRAESDLPPYDAQRILRAPFAERVQFACRTWASQVDPNPMGVLIAYWVKYIVLFAGGWAFFVSRNAGYPGFGSPGEWAFTTLAFQKAILWALFYELAGFGCSMGPMNARIIPPIGGFLYFLRPGTTKLSLLPEVPLLGGIRRTLFDVGLYAATLSVLMLGLIASEVSGWLLWLPAVLLAIQGISDKTIFLAARSEHYWVALVCLAAAPQDGLWIAACKVVWCAIWFWAAVSKFNHHFPSVIMFMLNNGPLCPAAIKKKLFVSYPDDLRPSRLAVHMSRMGALTEFSIPFVLLAVAGSPILTGITLFVMLGFHSFIAGNNPSGMPIEWNILMVFGGIFLFGAHPEPQAAAIASMPFLCAFLFFWLFAIPTFGNFFPAKMSFLLSMRYYAGNWAYNIWLVRKGSEDKLKRLTKISGTLREQLTRVLPDEQSVDVSIALSVAHRFMHLEGRPLLEALPKAVDDIEQYEWHEGEVLGGAILGWNFGDGHLNDTQLLEAVQEQCQFEDGELRVVMVESQPLLGRFMDWKIADAKRGVIERGRTEINAMRDETPWPTGPYARAFDREPTP